MPAYDMRSSFTKDLTAQLEQARSKGLDADVRSCTFHLGIRPLSKPVKFTMKSPGIVGNFARAAGIATAGEPHAMLAYGIPPEISARWQAAGGLHNMVPDLLLTGVSPFQSTISGGIGLGMCREILDIKTVANCKTCYGHRWQGSVWPYPDLERAVEFKYRKTLTDYLERPEKLDREYVNVPATPRNVRQGPAPLCW
jgi:hypothetical protein